MAGERRGIMRYGILEFKDPVPDISRKILHVDMDTFYANEIGRAHV